MRRVNIERDARLRRAAQRMQIDSIRTSTLDRLPADNAGRQETAADLGVDRTAMLRNEALLARTQKENILTFKPPSETRDRTHPYTGEMGLRLAPTCPDCTG